MSFFVHPENKNKYVSKVTSYMKKTEVDYRDPFVGSGSVYMIMWQENPFHCGRG